MASAKYEPGTPCAEHLVGFVADPRCLKLHSPPCGRYVRRDGRDSHISDRRDIAVFSIDGSQSVAID
jgi:hypothetical protein